MITVKHPDESCNEAQEKLLKSCPESMRRYHELSFTYGNVVYRYHNQARNLLSEALWLEWLDGLPETMKLNMQKKGFEGCKTILPFTRYVMERNDDGLQAYVERNMESADYQEYLKLLE